MNLTNLNKIKKNTILILIVFLLFNCNYKNKISEWDDAKVNSEIRKDPTYIELDKQEEILSAFEEKDSFIKKTSAVAYSHNDEKNPTTDYYSTYNNCRAHSFSDTLSISIGLGNAFGGSGFGILYFKNKFYTQPYYFDDVAYEDEVEPTYKTISQNLILDKSEYKPGDSLFGRIEFKSIETTGYNRGRQHSGKGYFRAKVRKPDFR